MADQSDNAPVNEGSGRIDMPNLPGMTTSRRTWTHGAHNGFHRSSPLSNPNTPRTIANKTASGQIITEIGSNTASFSRDPVILAEDEYRKLGFLPQKKSRFSSGVFVRHPLRFPSTYGEFITEEYTRTASKPVLASTFDFTSQISPYKASPSATLMGSRGRTGGPYY